MAIFGFPWKQRRRRLEAVGPATRAVVDARDFDPGTVGLPARNDAKPGCAVGETLFSSFDAAAQPVVGNGNGGHSFEKAGPTRKPGVIGRALSEDERYDLIEYLKTL